MKNKIFGLALAGLICLNTPAISYAKENDALGSAVESSLQPTSTNTKSSVKLKQRSKEEIIQKANQLTHNGLSHQVIPNKYTSNPSTTSPYYEGSLTGEFLQDGLNSINMVRYIAGFPDDIELTDEFNSSAQYGSVVLAANDTLSHHPTKPSDMSDDFYNIGYGATSSSNIGYGHSNLSHFNISCMDDSDSSNIDRLGHRRWILNPQLKYVGMGSAESQSNRSYYATKVFDKSRSETIDYDYITWPSKGFFPTQYFDNTQAWSISLNPQKYDAPNYSDVKVEVVRLSDNKCWTLDSSVPESNKTSSTSDYFNVNNGGYGINNCIIFRPGDLGSISNGDKFSINISGLKTSDGSSTTVSYTVEFFDINTPVYTGGWSLENGKWYYYYGDGSLYKGFLEYNGETYYLKSNGEMAVGWEYIDNEWYYFSSSGVMHIGWLYYNESWYYLRENGEMAVGWEYINNKWYYFNSSGAMLTGWLNLNGTWYYLDSSGAMLTGWLNLNGTWYYLDSSGAMLTGWLNLNGTWYYLYSSGEMAKNTVVDGWKIDSDGVASKI